MIKRKLAAEEIQKMKDGYIPAPYQLEEGEQINDVYLEPVFFENENGPTIGVTTCGVIVKDGLFLKIWTILENCHRTRIGDWIMRHAPKIWLRTCG